MTKAPQPKIRDSIDQDQFLTILSREEALERFGTALFPRHLPDEQCKLADALGRALAQDVTASVDAPPFDRSNVDGFAVRSADLAFATEGTPVRLMLNDEVIACGVAPTRPVLWGTATAIATGGPLPRGADSVVMIEHTQRSGVREIDVRRATSPGQFVSYAGSDIAAWFQIKFLLVVVLSAVHGFWARSVRAFARDRGVAERRARDRYGDVPQPDRRRALAGETDGRLAKF